MDPMSIPIAHLSSLPWALAPAPEGGQSNPFMGLVPLVLVLFIFYFLIIRPQQKRQREHNKMLSSLSKGDRIVTTGGLYAVIQDVKEKENKIVATIGEGVKVEIARSAVASIVKKS
jgi:preprotein translocase subunit YajC